MRIGIEAAGQIYSPVKWKPVVMTCFLAGLIGSALTWLMNEYFFIQARAARRLIGSHTVNRPLPIPSSRKRNIQSARILQQSLVLFGLPTFVLGHVLSSYRQRCAHRFDLMHRLSLGQCPVCCKGPPFKQCCFLNPWWEKLWSRQRKRRNARKFMEQIDRMPGAAAMSNEDDQDLIHVLVRAFRVRCMHIPFCSFWRLTIAHHQNHHQNHLHRTQISMRQACGARTHARAPRYHVLTAANLTTQGVNMDPVAMDESASQDEQVSCCCRVLAQPASTLDIPVGCCARAFVCRIARGGCASKR